MCGLSDLILRENCTEEVRTGETFALNSQDLLRSSLLLLLYPLYIHTYICVCMCGLSDAILLQKM